MKTVYVRIALAAASTVFHRGGIKHTKQWQKHDVEPATLAAFEAEQMLEVATEQPADFEAESAEPAVGDVAATDVIDGVVGVHVEDLQTMQNENAKLNAEIAELKAQLAAATTTQNTDTSTTLGDHTSTALGDHTLTEAIEQAPAAVTEAAAEAVAEATKAKTTKTAK